MIYGIGSVFDSTEEKLPQFVTSNVACVGWDRNDAPGLHQLLGKIGVGDIIFVKAYPPSSGLYIKAVGIVNSPDIFNVPNLGYGRSVSWIWSALDGREPIHLGPVNDRYDNMRRGTLYEELGPVVQQRVLDVVLGRQS